MELVHDPVMTPKFPSMTWVPHWSYLGNEPRYLIDLGGLSTAQDQQPHWQTPDVNRSITLTGLSEMHIQV